MGEDREEGQPEESTIRERQKVGAKKGKGKKDSARIEELEGKIASLEERLTEKSGEAEENYNKFLKSCANLENFKKRAEREKKELLDYSHDTLIKELLNVIDNLERALAHANDEVDIESLKKGLALSIEQIFPMLQKFGLEKVSAVGEPFDPNIHEAVSHEESSEHAPETVIREFQKGYRLKGRLLRPAMVAVSKVPSEEERETSE